MRTVQVDIEGLDLVLGGGVPILKRHESFAGESATIVVRGPPGSGKTVLGTQLAISLARTLSPDVAYACVELLPTELAAQHESLKRQGAVEPVVAPPFPRASRIDGECRTYAGMLDLGVSGDEQARLVSAVDDLLMAIREAGGKPSVLVIDSLSDGYHLGASVPRPLADELCKMAAQQGLILVLLEEATGSEQSNWCFAADLVIGLDIGDLPGPYQVDMLHRRLRITKNRFGPSEPGPHPLEISPASGARVYPNLATYTRPWAVPVLFPEWAPDPHRWNWGVLANLSAAPNRPMLSGSAPLYAFDRCVTIVFGPSSREVAQVAEAIGPAPGRGIDILLSLGVEPAVDGDATIDTKNLLIVPLGTWPGWLVARALGALSRIWATRRSIGRVFIGDLRRIADAWNPERKQEILGTLLHFLRRAGIPVILLETGQTGSASPFFAFAEIGVRGMSPPNTWVTFIRLGTADTISGIPQPTPVGLLLAKYL